MFDLLKRYKKFTDLTNLILDFSYKNNNEKFEKQLKLLNLIDEKLLLCSFVEFVSIKNQPRIGYFISKNDYPVPMLYQKFDEQSNSFREKVNFEIFSNILCQSKKYLALISGTSNAICKGKTSLIPLVFPGLNKESIISSNPEFESSYADVICNDETSENWIIADFHGPVITTESLNLRKALGMFSAIHILNTTLEDFKDEPSDELKNIFEWYKYLLSNNKQIPLLVILIRDEAESLKIRVIQEKLTSLYNENFLKIFTVKNISQANNNRNMGPKKQIIGEISKIIQNIESQNKIPVFSILNLKHLYEKLMENKMENIFSTLKSEIESQFENLFIFNKNSEQVKGIFELSNINRKLNEIEEEKKKGLKGNTDLIIKEKHLKNQLRKVEPFNKYMQFFTNLVLNEDYYTNLLVFEKCFLNLKKDKMKQLKKDRTEESLKLSTKQNCLKNLELRNVHLREDGKESKEFEELKNELQNLRLKIEQIDNEIDECDLTLDKFWDEMFLIIDWNKENNLNSKNIAELQKPLIEKHIELLKNGFSIHLLRGRPLKLESNCLELLFQKLNNKNIFVISVIGEQSSAKSSLLNSLFGSDFRTSAGRCTAGIYMNFVSYEDMTIVILDTEGLMSVESGNKVFDNQMATMAVLSSHLIIINHKGEISSNLGNLLGITFYTKLRLSKLLFKPTIIFVLRDQNDRNSDVNVQIVKLKEKLNEETSYIQESPDDIFDIDSKNLILLPNAFSEDKDRETGKYFKKRNGVFPDDIINLRKRLINHLLNEIKNEDRYKTMHDLYTKVSSNWQTMIDLGDGILSSKDLEEIRIRNELAGKTKNIIFENESNFKTECENIIKENSVSLNSKYDDRIVILARKKLEAQYTNSKKTSIEKFRIQTNVSTYPQSLKTDFENRINNNLEWLKEFYLSKWNDKSENIRHANSLQKETKEFSDGITELLRTCDNIEDFKNTIGIKFKQIEESRKKKLSEIYQTDDKIIEDIVDKFNNNKHLMNDNYIMEMSSELKFMQTKEFFFNREYNFEEKEFKRWIQPDSVWNKFKSKLKSTPEKVIKWIKDTFSSRILNEIFESVGDSSYLEDRHVRSMIHILDKNIFVKSPLTEHQCYFAITTIINDLILNSVKILFVILSANRDNAEKKEEADFKRLREEKWIEVLNDFNSKNDSRKTGSNLGNKIENKMYHFLQKELLINVCDEIESIILKLIKDPPSLVELTYQSSFGVSNYQNIFKYSTDINRYCLEVLSELTRPHVELLVASNLNDLTLNYKKLLKSLLDLETKDNIKGTKDVLQELVFFVQNSTELKYFKDLLKKVMDSDNGIEIKNLENFKSGFKDYIRQYLDANFEEQMKIFKKNFYNNVNEKHEKYIKFYLGCHSSCPECGSKCHLKKGHIGGHSSNKHVFCSFKGIRYLKTDIVVTEFCWSKKSFKEIKVVDLEKTYNSGEEYLQICHKDWFENIKENYFKYLNNSTFNFQVIRAWMNTRTALICKHAKDEQKELKDRTDYEKSWLDLEETCLKADFEPRWYNHKPLE